MRRSVRLAALLAPALAIALYAARVRVQARAHAPLRHAPVVVTSPLQLAGAVVRGASSTWHLTSGGPLRYGDPVPVQITSYCLRGTTRRGRYVRSGIVAADPKYFPLSRYIELYADDTYLGRFLVDDTGLKIRGPIIDLWLPTCRESVIFGRRRGTAVLVPRPQPMVRQAGVPRR
jgi:3D (Asp-Asp-Asp) domain-containing protein